MNYCIETPPPPPYILPEYDLLLKYIMADTVETKTVSGYWPREKHFMTYLTGGRTSSEHVMPQHIDEFVSKEVTEGRIKIKSALTFFERWGLDSTCYFKHITDLSAITPYSFVSNHCTKGQFTRHDNVIINHRTKTVFKFLRSKKSVRGFLMSMYIASAYSDLLGLAKCVAYYPSMMCAEYEYAGVNVERFIERPLSTLEGEDTMDSSDSRHTIICNQIVSIMKKINNYAKMTTTKIEPFNFCIDLSTNKVRMTCTEWLVPFVFSDGDGSVNKVCPY